VYALIGGFRGNQCASTQRRLGYAFLAEQVIALDAINPQVVRAWRALSTAGESSTPGARPRSSGARALHEATGVSKGVLEIVTARAG